MNPEIGIEVGLDLDRLERDGTILGRKLKGIGDFGGSALKAGLTVGIGTIIAGLGALTAEFFVATSAAKDAQVVQEQLNAVLESTQHAAGLSADELTNLAGALSQVTTFEDDAILSGENLLLTFTNIGKDVFPEATEAMLNMSQALGQDMKSSAVQLGKALNDPIKGVTALSRVGVSFTAAQKKQIEALVKTGKTMQAQKLILAELSKEFGGSARAAADTYEGRLKQLGNAIGEVHEKIGFALIPVLKEGAELLLEVLNSPETTKWLDELVNGVTAFIRTGFIPFLKQAVIFIGEFVAGIQAGENPIRSLVRVLQMFTATSGLGKQLEMLAIFADEFFAAIESGMNPLQALINTLQQFDIIGGIVKALEGAGAAIGGKLNEAIGGIQDWLKDHGPETWEQLKAWGTQFWDWVKVASGQIAAQVFPVVQQIASWLQTNWDSTIAPTLAIWATDFWSWLTGPGGVVEQTATELPKLTKAFDDWSKLPATKNTLFFIGSDVGTGIIDGIAGFFTGKSGENSAIKALTQLQYALLGVLPSLLHTFFDIGTEIGKGLSSGVTNALDKYKPDIYKWLNDSADALLKKIGEIADKIVVGLRDAISDSIFKKGGLFQMPSFGASLTPSIPASAGMGASGGFSPTINMPAPTFTVYIDGQEIKNAGLTVMYEDATALFNDATAAAMVAA